MTRFSEVRCWHEIIIKSKEKCRVHRKRCYCIATTVFVHLECLEYRRGRFRILYANPVQPPNEQRMLISKSHWPVTKSSVHPCNHHLFLYKANKKRVKSEGKKKRNRHERKHSAHLFSPAQLLLLFFFHLQRINVEKLSAKNPKRDRPSHYWATDGPFIHLYIYTHIHSPNFTRDENPARSYIYICICIYYNIA